MSRAFPSRWFLLPVALAIQPLSSACAPERPAAFLAPASSQPAIKAPKLWDERELATWATPIAGLGRPPEHFSEAAYYAAPVDNLRTYPVYHPRFEPPGYRGALLRKGPQPLIVPAHLRTEADWIAAGARVFDELDTPLSRSSDPDVIRHFTNAESIDKYRDQFHDTITPQGVLLDYRWVVDQTGKLNLSFSSCAGCHSRLMPDGTLLRGAPSNFDLSDAPAVHMLLDKLNRSRRLTQGELLYCDFGVPWRADDIHSRFKTMSDDQVQRFASQDTGEPPGTMFARFNGSPYFKTRMADLRGIRHRRFLDATGSHLNRGPADVARYGILVEFADCGRFGSHHMLPPEAAQIPLRPPDEAMYAMALYLYSLEPPPSPHPFNDLAKRGRAIFESESCDKCHTPPAYTNNKLVPVPGFSPPFDDPATQNLDISSRAVGTDAGLALYTRKGTGYYKVPSLRGLWYRGLYEHSGSVNSLHDWFNPDRLRDDFVPTGWRGPGVRHRAVPGHRFGLDLSNDDKRAMIAFLNTL